MEELFTIVSIDVGNDRARRRAVELLLDYGLAREQYSVFAGPMTRNRREELYLRLRALLREELSEDDPFGRVVVVPVGEREARAIRRFAIGLPRRGGRAEAPAPSPPPPEGGAKGPGEPASGGEGR